MVSTLSRRALSRLSHVRLRLFLWSVAVVMTNRPSANSMLSAKSGMISPTVKVPLLQPCFDHFFGPCFRGHDEAGLLAFEALQGSPRPARGTRTKRGSRGLESSYCWGPLAMIDGRGSGTLWCLLDLQEYCCLSKLRQFWQKKVTAESHFRSCKTLALDSKKWSSPVALKN